MRSADARTGRSEGRAIQRLVDELVDAACIGDGDDEALTTCLQELAQAAQDGPVDATDPLVRRAIARDVAWMLMSHDEDVAAATRRRARVLAAGGDVVGALEAWLEAAEVAGAQDAHDAARADVDECAALLEVAVDLDTALLDRLGRRAAAVGHAAAVAAWRRAADVHVREGRPGQAARALHDAWCASDEEDACDLLEQARAVDPDGGWGARAAAVLAFLDDHVEESARWAEQALGHARRAGDRQLEALALHGIACARSVVGDVASAIGVQRQALAVARAIGDARTLDAGSLNLITMLHDDLRGSDARVELERVRVRREAAGERGPVLETHALHAALLHAAGDVAGAIDELDRIDPDEARTACEALTVGYVAVTSYATHVDAGSDERLLDELAALVRRMAVVTGVGSTATRATMLDAIRLVDAGDAATALDLLDGVEVEDHGLLGAELALVMQRAAIACRSDAGLERAGARLAECRCSARIVGTARREHAALQALLDGDSSTPVEQVADEWERRQRPIDAGRLLLVAAGATGDERERTRCAARAAQLLARCGARGPAAAAQRLLDEQDSAHTDLLDVAESALFGGVDGQVRDRLLAHAIDARRPRGAIVHDPDDAVDRLWLVRSGSVRLCRVTDDERRLTIELLDAGSVLGEHALLGQSRAGSLAECESDVVLAGIPIDRVREAIAACPRLGANLLQLVGARMERGRQLAERVAFWTVDRRLARCLLDLDAQYGRPTLDGHRIIDRPFTHFQLAELVNARRETVGEFLKRQRAAGVLELRRRRLVLVDAAALAAIVDAREP